MSHRLVNFPLDQSSYKKEKDTMMDIGRNNS